MSGSVQYRVAFGKKDEAIEGADDAALVISVDAATAGMEPTLAYMLGRLKAAGHTGLLFDELTSGRAAATLGRLVQR